jgi:hypothetical protein
LTTAQPPAFEIRRRSRAGQIGPRVLPFAPPLISVVVELLTVHYDNPSKVGGLGLISVTPWPVFALGAMLSISFAWLLMSPELHQAPLLAHLVALAFLLPGLPGLLEQFPRFSSAWLHAGFVQAIIIHRHPIVGLDARFSWPGFFTGIASVVGMAHLGNAIPLIRWTPLALNLAFALPVFIIARALLPSVRRAWLVTWLFILADWVGQDYFSPQGMAYFIYLGCLAVILVGFHRGGRPPFDRLLRGLLTRLGSPARSNVLVLTTAQHTGLMILAMLAVIALSMEHQLTPVALTIDVIALSVARQTWTRFFAGAVLIAVVAWIAYGATSFWEGHLYSTLFGSGGSQAVQATVTNRIAGSVAHEAVVYERLGFAFGVWLIAAAAALGAFIRRRGVPASALILAFVPFLMLGVQSYGGEAALRVFLYTLPFMLIIIVSGFGDLFRRRRRLATAAVALLSMILIPLLLIARFGNEQFEQVTAGDVAAARYAYSVATPGSAIGSVALNALVGFQGLASYTYPAGAPTTTPEKVLKAIGKNPIGTYLLITPAQVAWAVVNDGEPPDWATKLEKKLARNPHFTLLFNQDGGRVYKVNTTHEGR